MPPITHVPFPDRIQAVLFDYGKVLSGPADPAAWARMSVITGLSEPELDRVYWLHRSDYDQGVLSGERYWQAAGEAAHLALTPQQVAALIDADTELWTQPNAPMIAWAARLQAAGTRTGILSNLGDAMMHGVLARFAWLSGFDHLLWSHTLNLIKPDPQIYAHAAAGLGVAAENILFIDDRADNIEGAAAAGLAAVQYVEQASFEEALGAAGLAELWLTGRVLRAN